MEVLMFIVNTGIVLLSAHIIVLFLKLLKLSLNPFQKYYRHLQEAKTLGKLDNQKKKLGAFKVSD